MADRLVLRVVRDREELAAALAIRRSVFVEEQRIPRDLEEDGLDDAATHVLVFDGERPVGTGRLVVADDKHGVLARIAVVPDSRGKGLGGRVVERLEGKARELGLRQLTLHPHRHLERFYSALGYETIGGTSVVAGHELITMTKRLG